MAGYIMSVLVFMLTCVATTVSIVHTSAEPLGKIPIIVLIALTLSMLRWVSDEAVIMQAACEFNSRHEDHGM